MFVADKLSKVRELRLGPGVGTPVRRRRLKHYRHCLAMLQERLPTCSLVIALQTELDALPDARRVLAPAR